jgi:hypothetical protein
MAAAVLIHLAMSVAHGAAHSGAGVPLSPASNLFVLIVILAGPLVGLAVSWRAERFGSLIVALAIGGALVFGLVNHFVLESPDHVSHVDARWRTLFATTATFLALTEMLGLSLAVRLGRERRWA